MGKRLNIDAGGLTFEEMSEAFARFAEDRGIDRASIPARLRENDGDNQFVGEFEAATGCRVTWERVN